MDEGTVTEPWSCPYRLQVIVEFTSRSWQFVDFRTDLVRFVALYAYVI